MWTAVPDNNVTVLTAYWLTEDTPFIITRCIATQGPGITNSFAAGQPDKIQKIYRIFVKFVLPLPSTTVLVYSSRSLPVLFRSRLQTRHPSYRPSYGHLVMLYTRCPVHGLARILVLKPFDKKGKIHLKRGGNVLLSDRTLACDGRTC